MGEEPTPMEDDQADLQREYEEAPPVIHTPELPDEPTLPESLSVADATQ